MRNGLMLVVIAALLPIVVLSIVQGRAAWLDSRALAITQLRGNAWLIAEGERDVFLVARQSLEFVSRVDAVQTMATSCSKALGNAHLGTPGLINLTRLDASGTLRCSAMPRPVGSSFAGDQWWQQANAADDISLSRPVMGRTTRSPLLVMSKRMKNANGAPDGLVTASISLEILRASLARRSASDTKALIEIIDARGNVVLSNNKTTLKLPDRLFAGGQFTSGSAGNGVEWLYASAPLHGRDLTIIYAQPRDDLLATALWQGRQTIWLPLIAIVLASLAIWWGAHWLVVRWLTKLRALAVEFGQGKFTGDRLAFQQAPREIADVSDDFHAMAETIASRDIALTAALAQKTELTREVNHRVKNNLQIVTSLLTLQADRVAEGYARDALGQARVRIAALGLIHRVLYEHDTHNIHGTLNMRLLMAELCPQMRASNRQNMYVVLQCDSDDFDLSVDQAVPLTLFIVEVVTNAFRHGFSDTRNGRVTVDLQLREGIVNLTVNDDGDGYESADPVGMLGFELMNAFASQLNGTLNAASNSSGTCVTLSCPLVQY